MDVELKPCPFCGGKPYMSRRGLSEVHAYADEVKIQCGTCSVYRSAMGDTSKPGYADNSTVEARAIEKWNHRHSGGDADRSAELTTAWMAGAESVRERAAEDSARLDYIERTFSGMTNRERYLPVTMIWGKGANGRTLREACDKYMAKDAARAGERGVS